MSHPADRRRIVHWAKNRGHEILLDLNLKHDVLFLSGRADFSILEKRKVNNPVILDLVDGYLGKEHFWKDWLRGAGKMVTGQNTGVLRPYRKIVSDACERVQAVVCETVEQRETIIPFCKNSHKILDFHEEFPILPFNAKPTSKYFPSLLWEGLPFTAKGLLQLRHALLEIMKSNPVSLEVVSDLEYPLFLGKYRYCPTQKILEDIPEILGDKFRLTKWNINSVVTAAGSSHMAVLPLDPKGTLNPLKAENRLLMMWRVGLPALTSPSLAYSRVMRDAKVEGICNSADQWLVKIMELAYSAELRGESVEKGQQYIRETHSEEILLKAWDNLFESVL